MSEGGALRRKRGRPALAAEERRTERFHLQLEDEALAALVARAERAGERPTTYAARRVLELLAALELLGAPEPVALERLRKAADVLNQEVWRLNAEESKGMVVDVGPADALRLRELLTGFREAVRLARARPSA